MHDAGLWCTLVLSAAAESSSIYNIILCARPRITNRALSLSHDRPLQRPDDAVFYFPTITHDTYNIILSHYAPASVPARTLMAI